MHNMSKQMESLQIAVPLVSFTFPRDVWHRDPVLLLLPALPGHAQLYHLPAHVQLRHLTHHHFSPHFREHHLQPA